MRIGEILTRNRAAGRPTISFEFFPPKTPEAVAVLFGQTMPALRELGPDFVSVTYGAGGSTRDLTLDIVDRAQRELHFTGMMHLTCVGSSVTTLRGILQAARERGIENVLALRGDPPAGEAEWRPAPDGLSYSRQLVELAREYQFSIGVAGFPEGHLACNGDRLRDWAYLREKTAAGAEFVITQLFFDNADYFAFAEHMQRRLGVYLPLIPGILPILTTAQIKRFTALCGARLPSALLERLEQLAGDDEGATAFGIEFAARQCEALLAGGAPGIHFYTLNRVHSTRSVLGQLGLAPVPPGE